MNATHAARRAGSALALVVLAAAHALAPRGNDCTPSWSPDFGVPGADGTVRALALFDDGSGDGPCLFVGGAFTSIDGVLVNHVARWDGRHWSPVGTGTDGAVRSFVVFDEGMGAGPVLFVGGTFTNAGGIAANGIARWDGRSWSPVSGASDGDGNGVNGSVLCMTLHGVGAAGGPSLVVGGWFTEAGGAPADQVARWDGAQWSAIGDGLDGTVFALESFDDGSGAGPEIYAGGWFTHSGTTEVNRIAKWNGNEWASVGGGVDSGVHALTVWDDGRGGGPALFVGGFFSFAGETVARNLARWDGTGWSALPFELAGAVQSLSTHDDGTGGGAALIAAGNIFVPIGDQYPFAGVAKWDGAEWSLLGGGADNVAYSVLGSGGISAVGNALYCGGDFHAIAGVAANFIARWQGCLDPSICEPEDFNCDGAVNGDDLGTQLGDWGPCPGCPTDLTGDGIVDGNDLGSLLGAWTP